MPTTLVFGASRGLGRAFTDQALRQGHRVLALVRQPEMAAELRAQGVEVIEGNALDPAAVQQACAQAGPGARVISTLGSFRQPQPVDYQGNRNVIDAMEQTGIIRLLLVTSLGCGDSWLQSSTLDWTILRPAGLQDGEATGRAELSQGEEVHGLVRRADVAAHGLRLLTDEVALGQIYAIGDPELHRA